jgi:hypothetical protein
VRGLKSQLQRVFARSATRPEGRDALEARLLEQFDRMHPDYKERSMKRTVRRVAFGAAAIAGLGVLACGAPAEVGVTVGTRLTVTMEAGGEMPAPDEIAKLVGDGGNFSEVQARVKRTGDKTTLELTLWGGDLPDGPISARLVEELPALRDAEIREEPLEAKVHTSVARKIGHDWFERDLAAGDIEGAKLRLIEEIRAREGVDAKVDVEITDDAEGRREVRVQVRKEQHE